MSSRVAAAVVTYNHRDAVLALLERLEALGVPTFVTENASTDGTREALVGRFEHVSVLASPANLGGCGGFDCAILAALSANTPYILLIDDDALPVDDCIDRLADFLDTHPDYVLAAPVIEIASLPGTLQEAGGGVNFACDRPVEAWYRFAVDPDLPPVLDIDYASACCLMVRTDAILRLGVMDWNYFIFSDDVDWSVRLRRAFGKRAACVTTARARHDFPWAKPFAPMRLYYFQRNGLYFLARLREGPASERVVRATVFYLLRGALYAKLIGDAETARTLHSALRDALRGRFGTWRTPVAFPGPRRRLDRRWSGAHRIRRVLLDITIEDVDMAALEAIRALAGDDVEIDVLCDAHRVGIYRQKPAFRRVHGRALGLLGPLKDGWRMWRQGYDLTVTDAAMEPRRPAAASGRRAAFFHDGALYRAAACGPWALAAHVIAGFLAAVASALLYRRFLVPPPPGRPPEAARPLLEQIGIRPDVGQPWGQEMHVPFPPMRASEAAVLRVPAPHRDPNEPRWLPMASPPSRSREDDPDGYLAWREMRRRSVGSRPTAAGSDALVSIVMHLGPGGTSAVEASLASIECQTHRHWELILVVDPDATATGPAWRAELSRRDSRISIAPRDGASALAEEQALRSARGSWILVVKAGDQLAPHALEALLAASERADIVYADDDLVDDDGRHTRPRFKPAFSPTRLRHVDYIGRPVLLRRSLVQRLGGFRTEPGVDPHYDLLLRAVGARARVAHVPDVLYHWRTPPPPARVPSAAVSERDDRAVSPLSCSVLVLPHPGPHAQHIQALWANATEVLFVPPSGAPGAQLTRLAARARGDVLVVTTSAVRPTSGWEHVLQRSLADPEIGLVGGQLRYADGRLHSAGLVLGIAGAAGRWHHGAAPDDPGYGGWIAFPHEVSALPAHLLAVRRDVVLAHGGFDGSFAVRGFDLDFALRLRERAGLRHLYLPELRASLAMPYPGDLLEPWSLDDLTRLWERWGRVLRRGDPYLNPNLSLLDEAVRIVSRHESDLRARGALAAWDRPTTARLARRFPGRLAGHGPAAQPQIAEALVHP